jgi:hypothetical protein
MMMMMMMMMMVRACDAGCRHNNDALMKLGRGEGGLADYSTV